MVERKALTKVTIILWQKSVSNNVPLTRGGQNVKNQNIEGWERRKFFLDDQNVENKKIRMSN